MKEDESPMPTPIVSPVPAPVSKVVAMEAEEDISGAESSAADGDDGPEFVLYNAIRNLRDADGDTIADPFIRLPNRR